jgi:hypothetical protein
MELRPRVELLEQERPRLKTKVVNHHRPLLGTNSPFDKTALHRHTVFADLMLRVAEVRLSNVVSLPFPKILEQGPMTFGSELRCQIQPSSLSFCEPLHRIIATYNLSCPSPSRKYS